MSFLQLSGGQSIYFGVHCTATQWISVGVGCALVVDAIQAGTESSNSSRECQLIHVSAIQFERIG